MIFGRGGWNNIIEKGPKVELVKQIDGKWHVTASCTVSIYIKIDDSFKQGVGSVVIIDTSENEAIVKALRAAEADAFNRAFVNVFGSNNYKMNVKPDPTKK